MSVGKGTLPCKAGQAGMLAEPRAEAGSLARSRLAGRHGIGVWSWRSPLLEGEGIQPLQENLVGWES